MESGQNSFRSLSPSVAIIRSVPVTGGESVFIVARLFSSMVSSGMDPIDTSGAVARGRLNSP